MAKRTKTRSEEIFDRIQDHKLLSVVIVLGTIIIAIGSVTSSLASIRDFFFGSASPSAVVSDTGGTRQPEALRQEALMQIKRDLASGNAVARRNAIVSLAEYPSQGIPLLVTSAMLGAINPEASQEDTALTSSVRETIVKMGPDALTPLIAEWRRVQTELADKFSVAPNDRVRADFVSFTRDYSHPSAIVSAGELTRRAGLLKLDLPENAQAMKVLVSRDTMELIAARRNTLRATADLLRAHDVPQLDFSQLIFNGDFSGAHLKSANLSHADLGGADLSRADLTGANLSESNLNIAKMAGATLVNANFNELDTGDGADLSGTNLRGATFVRARALRIRLQNADLTNADLTEAAMTEANMSGADLAGARLTRTVLTGADLSNVRNVGAIADIQYANLRSARGLSNADKATTTTRGAQWNETVAIGLDASPSADRFPGPFQQQIRYDERWRALVWTGGKMSPQHYDELRGLSNDVAYMNAVLALRYQTFYASLDTP